MKLYRYLLIFFSFLLPLTSYTQSDSTQTDEVLITGKRVPHLYSKSSRILRIVTAEEIKNAPVQSVDDLLEYNAGLDVRKRGVHGIQSDINLRGGSFDQVLILLNGIPVNDPQTGHHNMNLPVSIEDIKKIEILEGPGSRALGPNAFAGAINIITGSEKKKNVKVNLTGGQNKFYNSSIAAAYNFGSLKNYISASKKGSGPYIENTDFQVFNAFYQGQYDASFGKFGVQGGFTNKQFGANSFYTPVYPNQFEQTKTSFASAKFHTGEQLRFRSSAYWRRHQDRFELFRSDPADWYTGHNYHLTDVFGGLANLSYDWSAGVSALGAEIRSENILSNVLGEDMDETEDVPGEPAGQFTKTASRTNVSIYGEHSVSWDNLSLSAGLLINNNTDFDLAFYPGLDISYKLTDKFKLFGTVNRSLRLPTYTDLYYDGPANIGNPDLKPEESLSFETGFKFMTKEAAVNISVFRREGKNVIDWVKPEGSPDSVEWSPRNITEINGNGFQISAKMFTTIDIISGWNLSIKHLKLSYTYTHLAKNSSGFLSYYAMDYLRYKMIFGGTLLYKDLIGADVKFNFQDRAGTYRDYEKDKETPYEPVFLSDLRLFAEWKFLLFYVEASNLFDVRYNDLANIRRPGRWIRTGIEADINLGN